MSEPFVGQLAQFGFSYPPKGWALCQGQILPIAQYSSLFSLLGTSFGGNGTTNFALPDLRARVPVGSGTQGSSVYTIGQMGGVENVTLTQTEMPAHSHSMPAMAKAATAASPAGAAVAQASIPGRGGGTPINFYTPIGVPLPLLQSSMQAAGGNLPHNNMQPSLVSNWCIALTGIYPQRP